MKENKTLNSQLNVEKYIEQAIGLEHILHTIRDQICYDRINEHLNNKDEAIKMLKVCNPEARKGFKKILSDTLKRIRTYKDLEYKNNQSKLVTRMFQRVNKDISSDQMERFKDNSQDMYYEFSEILMDVYKLPKKPLLKAAVLIESDEGNFEYKGKKHIIVAK